MKHLFLIMLLGSNLIIAQSAFHNLGNVQIHDNGEIGFHTNLINDGPFNQNLGFVGFYNIDNSLAVSGTLIPRFFDIDISVNNNLFLDINVEVFNSISYTNGDIITPRENPIISLDFLGNALPILENDNSHVDGYTSYSGNDQFTFPIGNNDLLRPLIIPFQNSNLIYSAAYFNEDPNFPSVFTNGFNTLNSEDILNTISNTEFWDFDGTGKTQVTLTWITESNIDLLVNDLDNLRVVGWSISENRWLDLGNINTTGSLNSGTITSNSFIPNDYEIITFGSLIGSDDIVIYDAFSPNGDGINDFFEIAGIELFENELNIFNRWGSLVFKVKNYQNDWDGTAQGGLVLNRNKKLPPGTYFYTLNLINEDRFMAGPIFINH